MDENTKPAEQDVKVEEVVTEEVVAESEDDAADLAEQVAEGVAKYFETQKKLEKKTYIAPTASNKEEMKAHNKWADTIKFFNAATQRDNNTLWQMSVSRSKTLNEGTAADGGYLVPEEFESEVIRFINENSVIRQVATVLPMNTDVKRLNALTGDVTVYTPAEQGVITATTPTFAEPVLTALKYAGLANMTEELIEDSEVAIISLMAERFGKAIMKKEQNNFVNGAVSGSEGILQVSGVTTVTQVTTAGYANLAWDDLANMQSALFAVDEVESNNGSFLMSMSAFNALRTSKASGDGNYFVMNTGAPTAQTPYQGWSRPIYVLNEFPSPTGTATKYVAYSDWSNHAFIGDRRGIRTSFTDSHDTNFAQDIRTMKVTKRTAFVTALPTGIVALISG